MVKPAQAKRGFVLITGLGWLARFMRLSRDFERMPQVLAALHFLVFVMLMSPKVAVLLNSTVSS